MLSTVDILAPPGAYYASLVMPVSNPAPDAPVVVRDVKGLEPGNADVNSRGFGNLDGEFFIGSHLQKRNIVLTLALNTRLGDASVEEARRLVYAYLLPNFYIPIRFTFDNHIPVQIMGVVESVTGDRFAREPILEVSLICPQPDFISSDVKVVEGVSGPDDGTSMEYEALYSGTKSSGFILDLHGVESGDYMEDGYSGELYIETRVEGFTYKTMHFDAGFWIPNGWRFRLSTIRGSKIAQIYLPDEPDSEPINTLKQLENPSYWMILDPALNRIRVRTPGTDVPLAWTLTYYEHFGGV